jgi:hypothetical protein
MAGIFLVRNADGSMPPGAEEAIHRFQGHVHKDTKLHGFSAADGLSAQHG